MIAASDISIEKLASILDEAVVDYRREEDDSLYVTGMSFNFWVRYNSESKFLHLTTFWNFKPSVPEFEALQCANALNFEYAMAQFYSANDNSRLSAAYTIPTHEGLSARFFLRAARMFSGIYHSAIHDPIARHLLEIWPALSDDDCPVSEDDKPVLN